MFHGGGWVFQGDECSRGMTVLGDVCLGDARMGVPVTAWNSYNIVQPQTFWACFFAKPKDKN